MTTHTPLIASMEIYSKIISNDGLLICNYLFAFILMRAIWTAPWKSFLSNHVRFNALIGLTIWLAALWFFPVGVREGLKLHPLGATLCFLMFDWQIATLMLSGILLGSLYHHHDNLVVFGNIGLVMIVLPIAASWLGLRLFYRYGKPNYFGFVIWNGYTVSAMTMTLSALVNGWIIQASGTQSAFTMQNVYWNYLPILISIESVLTGAFISGFAAALPDSVTHFDKDVYYPEKGDQ